MIMIICLSPLALLLFMYGAWAFQSLSSLLFGFKKWGGSSRVEHSYMPSPSSLINLDNIPEFS
jgi:hypothetical protein